MPVKIGRILIVVRAAIALAGLLIVMRVRPLWPGPLRNDPHIGRNG